MSCLARKSLCVGIWTAIALWFFVSRWSIFAFYSLHQLIKKLVWKLFILLVFCQLFFFQGIFLLAFILKIILRSLLKLCFSKLFALLINLFFQDTHHYLWLWFGFKVIIKSGLFFSRYFILIRSNTFIF